MAATALALLAPSAAARNGDGDGEHGGADAAADLWRDLGMLFDDLEAARSLGRYYLAAHPNELTDVQLWARELDGERRRLGAGGGLRQALAEGRERDLRDGSVVVVEGWVVARTEARVCALLVVLG